MGIGPGGLDHLTPLARRYLSLCDTVVGYTRYVELIRPLVGDKSILTSGMTQEVERCMEAVGLAGAGRRVCMVSSGDSGIYGMAGPLLEIALRDSAYLEGRYTIEIVPGIPAFVACADLLGAPLMHDFAVISLSDILTPWDVIERRIETALEGDFVIVFYNPRSSKRRTQIIHAMEIVSTYRDGSTPVGIVRNATREAQEVIITSIKDFERHLEGIDMVSTLIIGNSNTYTKQGRLITPRGYRIDEPKSP